MPWDYFKSSYEKDRNKGWYKYYEIWIFLAGIIAFILLPVTVFFNAKEIAGYLFKLQGILELGGKRVKHVKWCMDT